VKRLAALFFLLCASFASAQSAEEHTEEIPLPHGTHGILAYTSISFSFLPRAAGPSWTIEVRRDLTGTYNVTGSAQQNIVVSEATMQVLGKGDRDIAQDKCETKKKHIAETGKKTITYVFGTALSTCTFNYSDDTDLMAAAAAFQGIAETMRAGEVLARSHRFDRLALDAIIDSFTDEVNGGRAIEVQNIRPVLESIRDDERVMERVRRKAAHLLESAH